MATALFDVSGAKDFLRSKAINPAAAKSVGDMNDSYAVALASSMQQAQLATGDTSLKLLQGERDPKEEAQNYANWKGQPYTYGGKTYQPATPGKSSGNKATTPNNSAHSYGVGADVSGGKNPAVTVSGAAIKYMTEHRADFGLANGSADLHIDDPAHFQVPQSVLNSIKVSGGAAIPAPNDLNLSSWSAAPTVHASQTNPALSAINQAAAQSAPVPMPGRPAALSGPQAAAPQPATPPANLRLPSGHQIAPGLYKGTDGTHNVAVTDDGHGNAVVKKIQNPGEIPGVLDPLNEHPGTVAGGIVRGVENDIGKQVSQTMGDAYTNATKAVTDTGTAIGQQASQLGTGVANAFTGLTNFLGGNGGQQQGTVPVSPTTLPVAAGPPSATEPGSVPVKPTTLPVSSPGQPFGGWAGNSFNQPPAAAAAGGGSQQTQGTMTQSPNGSVHWTDTAGTNQMPSPTGLPVGRPGSINALTRDIPGYVEPWQQSSPTPISRSDAVGAGPQLSELQKMIGAGNYVSPTTAYTQQQMTAANPEYLKYIAAQKADAIGAGPGSLADLQSLTNSKALHPANAFTGPQTITTTQQQAAPPSEAVRQLQSALGIHSDGLYGPQTDAAVRAFQAKNGLAVDGIVGNQTLAALAKPVAAPVVAPVNALAPRGRFAPPIATGGQQVNGNGTGSERGGGSGQGGYLNAQGQGTSGMTAGEVGNAYMKSIS